MLDITLTHREWIAVARELDAAYGSFAPAGLRERIAAMIDHAEPRWSEEGRTLTLDPASADVVQAIVRRGRGLESDPDLARAQAEGLAEAEQVLRDHQPAGHGGASMSSDAIPRYRIEHRAEHGTVVVAYSSDPLARHAQLSQHAAELIRRGEVGELVLVDELTGEELAWRRLLPEGEDDGSDEAPLETPSPDG